MLIRYTKVDPTKNITLLVHTPVPKQHRAAVAGLLLRQVGGEQVGFVSPAAEGADGILEMAGDEFCGNASLSAAALLAHREGLQTGETRRYTLTVSGAEKPVNVTMTAMEKGFCGTVTMPLPAAVTLHSFPQGTFPVVTLPGIVHAVVEKSAWGESAEDRALSVIKDWCRSLNAPGMGILLVDPLTHTIRPLVYIPEPETLVWENGCGSGSASYGAWLAWRNRQSVTVPVHQPGGVITAGVQWQDEGISGLSITGNAVIVEDGTLEAENLNF